MLGQKGSLPPLNRAVPSYNTLTRLDSRKKSKGKIIVHLMKTWNLLSWMIIVQKGPGNYTLMSV